MSGVTPEIAADFLIEAGEIVEQLGGQLVDLEKSPGDAALLNAVFRGFHTVKGGAGFLNLVPMVEICHACEDVFNRLRSGAFALTPEILDDILKSVDALHAMMQALAQGGELVAVDPGVIARLRAAAEGAPSAAPARPATAPAKPADPLEADFDAMLDQLHGKGGSPGTPAPAPAAPKPAADPLEADFEAMLDQLHGRGGAPGAAAPVAEPGPIREAPPKAAPAASTAPETTVRVETKRLDRLMNLVGELVLVRNRFMTLRDAGGTRSDELDRSIASLDQITGALQNAVMQTRMQPIGKLFARFPKLTRDVARTLKKKVDLKLVGEDTDLDKNLVEALADPLVHLLRNAIDHGIETPEARVRAGKPEAGTVELAAQQEGDHVLITIRDDGAGMDPEVLRRKAREKGLLSADAAAALDAAGCFQLIFLPGFSTKSEISEVSGRGVGMDVVKSRLTELNGSIVIESERGRGTTIALKLPLTLAILPALMVVVSGRRYALPLASVQEVFQYDPSQLRWMDRRQVLTLRQEPLPLFFLSQALAGAEHDGPRHVVVVQHGGTRHGLVVDEVVGRQEVVIKPLGALLTKLPGFAGGTITGDGRIALIADLPNLLKSLASAPTTSVQVH